jgi:hypothetical protein
MILGNFASAGVPDGTTPALACTVVRCLLTGVDGVLAAVWAGKTGEGTRDPGEDGTTGEPVVGDRGPATRGATAGDLGAGLVATGCVLTMTSFATWGFRSSRGTALARVSEAVREERL